jgi:hypothetical protein
MAVAPDFRSGAFAADEGVVARHAPVGLNADDLAVMVVEGLRAVAKAEPFAERNEQSTVGRESQPRAVVHVATRGRVLAEDHLKAFEPATSGAGLRDKARPGDGRAIVTAGPRLGKAEINELVVGELGIEDDVEKSALAARDDRGQPRDRGRHLA